MSATMELKPAKRIVSKAFDGTAAINALIMKRMSGGDLARALSVAEGLLDYGLPQVDVQDVVGLPQKVIAAAARKTEMVIPRAGRRPNGMGKVFSTPMRHLRMSIFLGMIDNLTPGLRKQQEHVTGEVLLAALRHTDMVCGPMSDEYVGVRYYLTAVHKMSTGDLFLKTCNSCGVRHIRTREGVRLNGAIKLGVDCPYCQYLRYLKAKARKKINETRAAAHQQIDVAPGEVSNDFDEAGMGTPIRPETGQAAFEALMG